MSNLRLNSGKSEVSSSTIGFRFHTNDEELEEVRSEETNSEDKNTEGNEGLKVKAVSETPEYEAKVLDENDIVPDAVKDHWNLLGRKSSSIDSSFESAFSNPIETWKKLNVLKEKIAKTVEEKISEMKIDRNVLSKSNHNKLACSKENSSISDSEDTSESSKITEQWRDAENQILSLDSLVSENSETCSSQLETPEVESIKEEKSVKESENELRNRKGLTGFSELIHLPDIKVVTAKSELDGSIMDDSLTEEVESGVEAAEHLETSDTDSVDAFDGSVARSVGGSENPPGGIYFRTLGYLTSSIIPYSYIIALILSFVLYSMFPLSDFIRGFLLSSFLAMLWGITKSYVRFDDVTQQKSFIMPDYKSMPPLKVPELKSSKGVWVNEYEKEIYDPDYYSVTETVPAYLELDNNILKLSRPKGRVSKRATFDEPEYKLQFIGQRIYNISGCNVNLMPDGLTKKRLFSKKYPIVIFLKPDSLISEKKNGKEIEEKNEKGESEEVSYSTSETSRSKSTLYLFARCDRQKQEWYRKLLSATRFRISPVSTKNGKIPEGSEEKENYDETPSKESSTPFEHLFFDDEVVLLEEYSRYMTKFVNIEVIRHEVKVRSRSSWYRKLRTKKKDTLRQEEGLDQLTMKNVSANFLNKTTKSTCTSSLEVNESEKLEETSPSSIQIQWFNAFVNRILFDIFRSSYWLNKIHDKLQRKLNSIRLPYYIEDIEVIEMDLGKNGPIFHRVSQPVIDELGLWFDMDTTFNGLIRLTIQTHLNLVKLQKGMEEGESAQIHEKLKKEKKKPKEARDVSFDKESKEKSNENVGRKSKKWSKFDDSIASDENNLDENLPNHENSELECKSCEDCRNKLFDELAQLTEIVIEESLAENKKLKNESDPATNDSCKTHCERLRSAIYDSELEDSAESSDEDEEEEKHPPVQPKEVEQQTSAPLARRYPRDRKSSKIIFKMFENVAQSKYFRSMAQSKYIQKAIAGVSAAKLKLTVEVKSCTGTLVINVPPPPNDRFWYGFREMPKLVFSANPKIGDKSVRFAHIRNYLQKKILHELKKVMVVPNMIDFVLPTSVQTQGSNSPQYEDSDLQEVAAQE